VPTILRRTFLVVVLAVAACTASEGTSTPPSPRASSATLSSSPATPVSPATTLPVDVGDRLAIVAPPGGSFEVRGAYPRGESDCPHHEQPRLRARYPGRLTVRREDDGTLTLTVRLPFERYLEGIAEVPPTWPRAALEAQAIAARSYALASTGWRGEPGETLDRPICSTTSCQVYAGMPLGHAGSSRRWVRAVRETRGLVLLHEGRPATTFYFSTSNGRTYGNEEVFGGSPLPYLRGIVERHDGASPTSRWRSAIPFRDLARFLSAHGVWPVGRRIAYVEGDGSRVAIRGGGTSVVLEGSTFREAVNAWAPCLAPSRYPPGALPITIPSRWMRVTSSGGAAVSTGRGWGHGVGMVQWGAYGRARRGASAAEILAAYYGGLRPQRFPEPGVIDVRIATGLTRLRFRPSARGATVAGEEVGVDPIVVTAGDTIRVGA
jgi:SpoIID/LytB domain protein